MSSVEVQQRLNELSLQKQNEAEMNERRTKLAEEAAKALVLQQEKERKDAMINCEAEAILFLETLTDAKIISEFTEDKEPDSYVVAICRGLHDSNSTLCIIQNGNPCRKIGDLNAKCYNCKDSYAKYLSSPCVNMKGLAKPLSEYQYNLNRDVKIFKIKYIHKYVINLINPIYQKRLESRKERENAEEQSRRQKILDETNSTINKMGKTTFTNLTLDDWDKRHEKHFICIEQGGWSHYRADTNNKRAASCYTGMPASFANYYEEGKVPFLTKCPTCKSLTKFNYLHLRYQSPMGNCDSRQSCSFKEVYCDKHYFYDSSTNKHYVANSSGNLMYINRSDQGAWDYKCWEPSVNTNINYSAPNNNATKWKEWDPSDPDGSKAIAEKKKLEANAIKKQILELQAKLTALE